MARGKTASLKTIRKLVPELTWFDFDDYGVPENADKIWRHQTAERWLQEATKLQIIGRNAGLDGNVTFGEILALSFSHTN